MKVNPNIIIVIIIRIFKINKPIIKIVKKIIIIKILKVTNYLIKNKIIANSKNNNRYTINKTNSNN